MGTNTVLSECGRLTLVTFADGLGPPHRQQSNSKQGTGFFRRVLSCVYAIMGNHFHLLVPVSPEAMIPDEEVRQRFRLLYGEDLELTEGVLDHYRNRFSSLSAYLRDIKKHHKKSLFPLAVPGSMKTAMVLICLT